ncbi:A disintegrin and metalloproteinase with thrombospondin motifs 1 [Plakobranchus ocellatus]|uniref:A disintegrin and metalloproteinase with thrombospondin motifs 1 n=1 Tax=Plakobranchus ocellatus TaxID=259542 RepID=A0AAV4D7L7_9GAST|nr:A disintegrin and metalloproteinase with thrombospondin motifs 1 [Plakobranchus ocellatus]
MKNFKILFLLLQAILTQIWAAPVYKVEVYFVADKSVIDRYVAEQTSGNSIRNAMVSLKADINYIITEINEIFASLRPMGLHVVILKKKLSVMNFNMFPDDYPKRLALRAFYDWLATQKTAAYDAAILWTAHSFENYGIASFAKVCKPVDASAVVFYHMTYQTSVITAHELGHIMGARHDPENSEYLMAPTISPSDTKRWQFSLSAKNEIDAVLAKPSSRCLKRTSASSTAPSTGVTVALANPDTICRRRRRNKGSYMCKNPSLYDNVVPQGNVVCKMIWCYKVNTRKCIATYPSEGLICGKNKRCNKGKCRNHPDAESAVVDPDCIWGDQAEVRFVWSKSEYEGDCAGLKRKYENLMCYDADVARYCCGTCGKFYTGIKGCEYGDVHFHCNNYTQADICDYYSDICCLFCQGYKKTRSSESSRNISGITNDLSLVTIKVIDDLKIIPNELYKQTPPPEED